MYNVTEIIKNLREAADFSIKEAADFLGLGPGKYARAEAGDAQLSFWQFKSLAEAAGQDSDDYWMLFLDAKEFEEYQLLHKARRLRSDNKLHELLEFLERHEAGLSERHPLLRQYHRFLSIDLAADMPREQAVGELLEAMRMSREDFDESAIRNYRLTFPESCILAAIASHVFELGDAGRAIAIAKSMIRNRLSSQTTEEEREGLFPLLYFSLANMLGNVGRHEESLAASNEGVEFCREHGNFRWIPKLLHNSAFSLRATGEGEAVYAPLLSMAYHSAFACGLYDEGKTIKENAGTVFGIELE